MRLRYVCCVHFIVSVAEVLDGKKVRSNHRALSVMVLALAIGVLLLIVYSPRPVVPPNVTITFDGYVRSSRLAAFTISNASPFTIAYSGHYRIQLRADGGWSNLAEAWLPNGAEMRSGQSDSVTLIPPAGGREWRAEFDVFAHEIGRAHV